MINELIHHSMQKQFGYFNQSVGYVSCMHANLIICTPYCIQVLKGKPVCIRNFHKIDNGEVLTCKL